MELRLLGAEEESAEFWEALKVPKRLRSAPNLTVLPSMPEFPRNIRRPEAFAGLPLP